MVRASLQIVLAMLASLALAGAAVAQTVVATLPAGANPSGVALNPVTNKTYVANQGSNTVTVIHGATHAATTVAVGASPGGVAVNPRTNRVYVANTGGDSVSVIDGGSDAVVATVPAGASPTAIAINAVTNRIYAANLNAGSVTVIDGAANTATTIAVGAAPRGLAVNPVRNRIYVVNTGSDNVSVIDGAAGAVIATIPVGSEPQGIAVNPVLDRVYVTNFGSATLSLIDEATHAVTPVAVGLGPWTVAVNVAMGYVYVGNGNDNSVSVLEGPTGGLRGTVAIGAPPAGLSVDAASGQVYVVKEDVPSIAVIDIAMAVRTYAVGTLPRSVAVNPLTHRAYVTNGGSANVTVIDGSTNEGASFVAGIEPTAIALDTAGRNAIYVANRFPGKVSLLHSATGAFIGEVATGADSRAIAFNPATSRIYVANEGNDTVTVIDAATLATTTVGVGDRPWALAVNPVTNKVYVANFGDGSVTVIDGETNRTVTIATGGDPRAVAINLVTNKIYVANQSFFATVIDGVTNAHATIALPSDGALLTLAVNAVTDKVYVTRAGGWVTVIDGPTNATSRVAVGAFPISIAINTATNRIYVANQSSNDVTEIDGATNATTTIPAGTGPQCVAVNPVTNKIYVGNRDSGDITVIDGVSRARVTLPAGVNPIDIVVNPVTNRVYTANQNQHTVTRVNVAGFPAPAHGLMLPPDAMGLNSDDDYAFSAPVGILAGVDPALRTVYSRLGDAQGAHSPAPGAAPHVVTVAGLQPGMNYVSLFAMDALEGTSINASGGGYGGTSAWIGAPRILPILQTPPYVVTSSLLGGTVGFAYSTDVLAKGPFQPLTFVIGQGTLPPGLHLNVAQPGSITGSPTTAGTFPFTVTVTDPSGGIAHRTLSITIAPAPVPTVALTVAKAGAGTGTVVSSPAGIACGAMCTGQFAVGGAVSLTATASSGSFFAGWSGGGCSGTGTCSVTMNAATGVTATFGLGAPPPANPPRLGNLSTRGQVLTGNDLMIGGFVIGGFGNKTVVVRARGPSLVPFGIANALANPTLRLVRSSDQATIATNDNWQAAANAADITASGFAPSEPLESAILVALPPGAYTAIVEGASNGTGVGIVEVFEVDALDTPLVNISTRGQVLTGNDVMIGGFVIQGSGPQTVVVRARGPSLVPFGITNALANPTLRLVRSSDQATLATNDNWGSATNAAAITASCLAPGNALEAAILMTLDPGAYTAIVSGAGGGTGVGIVEMFAVQLDVPHVCAF